MGANYISKQKCRYIFTFVDVFSDFSYVCFGSEKSEAMKCFKTFKMDMEAITGKRIKTLRTDGGGEFTIKQFEIYIKSTGIIHQITIPYIHYQNGKVERMNRVLEDKARCVLLASGLPTEYWQYAAQLVNYLRNRSPTMKWMNSSITPYEVIYGKKPYISMVHVFGL